MHISPITRLQSDLYHRRGVVVHLKRDDMIGGPAQGNKMRKLKYLLQDANSKNAKTLITFGGAFSNHLFATAWAAQRHGFKSVGYVRGEIDPKNPTMGACAGWGMTLCPLSRSDYRLKEAPEFVEEILKKYPHGYIIAEGGFSEEAMRGMQECATEILQQQETPYDFWVTPCATGATLGGLINGAKNNQQFIAASVLKGASFGSSSNVSRDRNIKFVEAHLGGFAKFPPELISYIKQFQSDHGIFLDPVYTGKMMFKLDELISQNFFVQGGRILAIHTGGHQGISGFNYRFGNVLPVPTPFKQ